MDGQRRRRFFWALVTSAMVCLSPQVARAQTPTYATRGETIRGSIASVQSVNHITVTDDRGFTDDVTLRTGTAVGSGGLRLEPGQRVTISGSAAGRTFMATRIETSGESRIVAATAPSYPAPAYYPAPVYYAAPVYYPVPLYYSNAFYGAGFAYYGGFRRYGSINAYLRLGSPYGYGGYRNGYAPYFFRGYGRGYDRGGRWRR